MRLALGTAAALIALWMLQELSPVHPRQYRVNEPLALQASGRFGQKAGATLGSPGYVPEARRSEQIEGMLRTQLGQFESANPKLRLVSARASLGGT